VIHKQASFFLLHSRAIQEITPIKHTLTKAEDEQMSIYECGMELQVTGRLQAIRKKREQLSPGQPPFLDASTFLKDLS
jgi:hypothetical protein